MDERTPISLLVAENQKLILLQNGQEIYNRTLSHLQIPEISAVYGTATMEVINNIGYIGGFNGTIYRLHISVNGGEVSVNVSTVELNLPCTAEVFTNTDSGVTTACFGHSINTLYIINVNSPGERSELKFTNTSDLSNILPVNEMFYYAQSNHLFRGDTSGQRVVETLQNCIQPLLVRHKNCCLIIHCPEKSHVFVPPEWGAPGIWEGSWEDKKPYPCYGIGTSSYIYSYEGAQITFYDIRNDFKQIIILGGAPDPSSITCAWNKNDLVLFYKENVRCDCWIRYEMNSNLEYKNSTVIPSSHGTLHPLSTSKGDIDQSILLFYSDVLHFLMLPSENQVMIDLRTGFIYSNITSDVILYHGMILRMSTSNSEDTGKKGTNDKSTRRSHDWTAYVAVGVGIAVLTTIVVVGIIGYCAWRRRYRIQSRSEIISNEVVLR